MEVGGREGKEESPSAQIDYLWLRRGRKKRHFSPSDVGRKGGRGVILWSQKFSPFYFKDFLGNGENLGNGGWGDIKSPSVSDWCAAEVEFLKKCRIWVWAKGGEFSHSDKGETRGATTCVFPPSSREEARGITRSPRVRSRPQSPLVNHQHNYIIIYGGEKDHSECREEEGEERGGPSAGGESVQRTTKIRSGGGAKERADSKTNFNFT